MADGTSRRSGRQKTASDDAQLGEISREMGNRPPQALDFEQRVLGALLIDPDCTDEVLGSLTSERMFYDPRHRIIYSAIQSLHGNNNPVDSLSVAERLRAQKINRDLQRQYADVAKIQGEGELLGETLLDWAGGESYLISLTEKVESVVRLEYYTKIVKQKYIQRELIQASYRILRTAFDDAVNMDDLVNLAESSVYDAVSSSLGREAKDISSILQAVLNRVEELQKNDSEISGVPSGYPTLDGITMGWQPSDLIILAARPSVGKTAFALNIAVNAAKAGYPVAVFSLEMSNVQLGSRMLMSETGVDGKKLKGGGAKLSQQEWNELQERARVLSNSALYIDDTSSLPVMEFRSKAKKLVKQKGVRLIVVDYLQLMQGPPLNGGLREQEVAAVSRMLKATAKELSIPIIALSQLNRATTQREGSNRKPMLSDLRESGSIEQDADMVLFLHRPDYYREEGSIEGDTDLIIAKHRNGEVKDIKLIFHKERALFEDAQMVSPEGVFRDTPPVTSREVPSRMNQMPVGPDDFDANSFSGYDNPDGTGDFA